jgi:hypothetical protein
MENISWKLEMADTTRFSYLTKDEDGQDTRRGGFMRKAIVVVSFMLKNGGRDAVAFAKTSRSRNIRDSRFKTLQSEDSVRDELTRWLGSNEAERALQALRFA